MRMTEMLVSLSRLDLEIAVFGITLRVRDVKPRIFLPINVFILRRRDWLPMLANIKDENNGFAVYG